MKPHHNTNGFLADRTDPAWAERVEREVEQQMQVRDNAWAKAHRRFAKAMHRRDTEADKPRPDAAHLVKLEHALESRRDELAAIERLMTQSPAGSQHRGIGSYRHLPKGSR